MCTARDPYSMICTRAKVLCIFSLSSLVHRYLLLNRWVMVSKLPWKQMLPLQKWLVARATPTTGKKNYSIFGGTIGRHAAENSNINPLRKFKSSFPDLGESTVRFFKVIGDYEAESSSRRQCNYQHLIKENGQASETRWFGHQSTTVFLSPSSSWHYSGTSVIIAAAKDVVMPADCTLLAKDGGTWTQLVATV